MVKKMFYFLMVFLFLCAFTITTTPVYAQEEEEEVVEDVADISLEDLLNVEITTAGKRPEKIGEIPASVVVVTREDIEKYGYQDLAEVLQNIPGLYMTDDYTAKYFGVRGFWTFDPQRNVVILVNGIRQTYDITMANYLRHINMPVEAIDRIEVVRGPMSVIYGTSAFFGAINIFTNKVEPGNEISQVSAAAGSESTFRLFARSSGKIEDFQYAFNGSYFGTNGLNIPFEEIDKVGLTPLETTENLLEESGSYFNFSGAFKEFTFDVSYTDVHRELLIFLPSLSDGTLVKDKAARVYVEYEKELSDQVRLNAKLGYFMNRVYYEMDFWSPNFFGIESDGSTGYSAEMNLFLNPTPQVNLTIGAEYRNVFEILNDLNVPALGLGNTFFNLADGESIVTMSAYTQLNWKIAERLNIVAGVRLLKYPEYDLSLKVGNPATGVYTETIATYSETDIQVVPRAALIWGLDDNNYLKFLYGEAINLPSFFQISDMAFVPGLEPLQPETIRTLEFNYVGTLSPKYSVSLSLFHNMLDKLIYRTLFVIAGEITSYYQNVGEVTTTGAELTITARPSEMFTLELSGTYQDTKDKREGFEDIDVGYAPRFLGYVKASFFFDKDISIAVTGTYVDKMESYYDDTLPVPGRLGEPVDAYFLLGANLRIRNLFGTKMFLNIRGSNLLDQEIRYPTTSFNNSFATEGTVGRGMFFMATLGFRFIPQPQPQP